MNTDAAVLNVVDVTLQVIGFLDTVLTVSLVVGVTGLLLLLVGGAAIVRAHRRPLPDESAAATDAQPVSGALDGGR